MALVRSNLAGATPTPTAGTLITQNNNPSGGYYDIEGDNLSFALVFGKNGTITDGVLESAAGAIAITDLTTNVNYGNTSNINIDSATSTKITIHFIGGSMTACQVYVIGDNVTLTHRAS